ncbi:hypothetical protein Ate02nite_41130 [Paractinoplanes tereljensis]|uniref:Uncharacterized protein n=1 Tax=Paractinoplanes tereljensis TaxID=571912 RepID=A0A919NMT8_9ACTN|nr:hypothetical protein Ate02nite_41130 [Actinoplanes tereljensis]
MHRDTERAVPAEHRDGQQREPGLAGEGHQRPHQTDPVGAAEALHQGRSPGHHQRRQHDPSFADRAGHRQQHRHTGNCHPEHSRFGVPCAEDESKVEDEHSG